MKSIDILVEEHENILKVLKSIRRACIGILEKREVHHGDFYDMIDFIRNYADHYHHGKEEDMLFNDMASELGENVKNGPIQGMLLEHDLGRRFVGYWEAALRKHENGDLDSEVDIIANAIGYATLLQDHITKENNVLYKLAQAHLKESTKARLDKEFDEYEGQKEHQENRKKYIRLAEDLHKKYG